MRMTRKAIHRLIVISMALAIVSAALFTGCLSVKKQTQKEAEPKAKAIALYKKGDYAGAAAELKKRLSTHPGDYEAQVLLASSYIISGKTLDAYKETKKAYMMSKNPDVGYQLALLAEKLGKFDEAVGYLKDAVKARPGSAPFRTQLADFYLKYHKYNEAIAELSALLKLLPKETSSTSEVYAKLATAYEATGKLDKAAEARAAAGLAPPQSANQ